MTTIYYLSTIIFLLFEWKWLVSPVKMTDKQKKFFELSKEFNDKKWDEFSEEYKSELKLKIWHLWVLLWMFIGLFTFQWIGFLAMLVFNIFIISPLSKLTRFTMTYTLIHWLNSVIGFGFGIFIIINHYHLKIDLTQWVLSFLKYTP
jgi:hypothetical protein